MVEHVNALLPVKKVVLFHAGGIIKIVKGYIMKYAGSLVAVGFFVMLGFLPLHGFNELRLLIPEFRPYTYEGNGSVQGTGMQFLQKVLKESGVPYSSIVVSSYEMAVSETKTGKADGFFPAAARTDRDSFAVFAGPILYHRWTWFLPADSTYNPDKASFKPYARVGTLQHSAMHTWLKDNGYRIGGLPSTAEALIVMLKKETINTILMPEAEFLHALEAAGGKPGQYRMVVQFETPLGLYISKVYLEKNPGVLQKITEAIEKPSETKGD